MRVIVTSNYSETGEVAGGMIAKVVQDKPTATLGLATGKAAPGGGVCQPDPRL